MERYDYRCLRCDTRKIVFRELLKNKVVFYCSFCGEDFVSKDKEHSYFHHKIALLRKRYPESEPESGSEQKTEPFSIDCQGEEF
jgi:DNA-directed RNA polymerase subunit RPC12/RpoP